MAKCRLGWLSKRMMRNAPPFCYAEFPDIPLTLITHSSANAIEESMNFGNNTRDFATRIEDMWQNVMKDYLVFSKESRYVQAEHSGHYIHLTEPDLIVSEVDRMLHLL